MLIREYPAKPLLAMVLTLGEIAGAEGDLPVG